MKYLKRYLAENLRWLAVILFIALTMTTTMLLNEISLKEIAYGLLLCGFLTIFAIFMGYTKHYESFCHLEQLKKTITTSANDMKMPEYMYELQYQDCIQALSEEKIRIQNEMLRRQQDMTEYYSMWVHQIKTPIAALKLLTEEEQNAYLEAEDIAQNSILVENSQQKQQELFRIEQYVDMALQYIRLGTGINDFVIEELNLDEIIKPSIHKFAKQFIHKKLRLTYETQGINAVTDKKWFGFVMDQLLSNAIKYTKQGGITIQVTKTQTAPDTETDDSAQHWYHKDETSPVESVCISIEDTGIGIRAEDLPRICEKGYTGYNGHADKYSTGIGLYLCREILDKLGHPFNIISEEGKGTKVELFLPERIQNCNDYLFQ